MVKSQITLIILTIRTVIINLITTNHLGAKALTGLAINKIAKIRRQLNYKKGKGKAVKIANLLARIDEEIPLIDRMEDINNYNERVFIAIESDKTNKVVQMDVDNDDAVSLGDDDTYEDARQFYADNDALDGDYTKYGNGLLNKKLAKDYHTVKTMGKRVKIPSLSRHYSSSTVDTTACNKTVFTVQRVMKASGKMRLKQVFKSISLTKLG